MKTFQAECYNLDRRCYETVLVRWLHSSINGRTTIKEVIGKDGNIKGSISPEDYQAIQDTAERFSRQLTHEERVQMMNELTLNYEG